MKEYRILAVEYKADITTWQGYGMCIEDRARNLASLLECADLGNRPLIFVCHRFECGHQVIIFKLGWFDSETNADEYATISSKNIYECRFSCFLCNPTLWI